MGFEISGKGWLCLSKPLDEHQRVGEGYADESGESYVWKAELGNGRRISSGDVIAIWDGHRLVGVSRIEGEIEEFESPRQFFGCPQCARSDVKARKGKSPRYRCAACSWTGEEPIVRVESVTYRRASFGAGWTEVEHFVSAATCRSLSVRPKSQLSLRDLDMAKLSSVLEAESPRVSTVFARRDADIQGGHVLRTVRTRVGQDKFREALLGRFGSVCAFSGPQPEVALEAAHLYSYSTEGVHHADGGLLMRRDIHRLFDKGLLGIDPEKDCVVLHSELKSFPLYSTLEGMPVAVELQRLTKDWLATHCEQFGLK